MAGARAETYVISVLRNSSILASSTWQSQEPVYGVISGLNQVGYIHETVNHSVHYVDPVTGIHTNNTEAQWSACKVSFRRALFGIICQHTSMNTCGG